MKVLSLNFKKSSDIEEEDVAYVEFVDGEIESHWNFIRECVESTYYSIFNYKGIEFNEEIIITALSNYYYEEYKKGSTSIDVDTVNDMFSKHQDLRETDEITDIKRICIEYMRKVLFEV